jgi:hypothetical protein
VHKVEACEVIIIPLPNGRSLQQQPGINHVKSAEKAATVEGDCKEAA